LQPRGISDLRLVFCDLRFAGNCMVDVRWRGIHSSRSGFRAPFFITKAKYPPRDSTRNPATKADIARCQADVRITPESRHWLSLSGCPLCAKSGRQFGCEEAARAEEFVFETAADPIAVGR